MRLYPFVFTGKERDEETGFGYFGARYMDHELMTMWLSVDPMADKYPNISHYAYCNWNPVKLVDPDGREWYQKGNDYYWSDKVVSKKTTPEGCKYIGDNNSLYKHFGLPSTSERKESSQVMHTLVGTNAESNNPYESKYSASGLVSAKAKSSIDYSIQKDEKTGKLTGLTIKANLETAVADYRAGGYAAAFLEVSCGSDRKSVAFKDNDGYAFVPRDMCSRRYMNASVSFSANKLSENCFSKIQIKGPWFSNGRPMTHILSSGVVPGRLKHQYK